MKLDLSSEGLARSSSRHAWRTIGIWVALIVVALVLTATLLAGVITTEFKFTNNPDSKRGDALLEKHLRGEKKITEVVVVRSSPAGPTVDEQPFQDQIESLYGQIIGLGSGVIEGGTNYYQTGNEFQVSRDRHTTIMPFVMVGNLDQATDNMEAELLDMVREADGKDGFQVLIAGEASFGAELNELTVKDIEKGERIGVPVALIILLVLFGAVLAALLPILLAIVAIIVALGAAALVGQATELIFFVTLMITMIGLAVGIDYSLIVVSRFREELARGLDKYDAIARTGATASRTVVFSGITVVLALAGMLIIPTTVYRGLAMGAILVVISAVMASLTLMPAVLTLLGHRVNALRLPFIGRRLDRRSEGTRGGLWDWIIRLVMAQPLVSLVVSAAVLIAAASSLLDIDTGFNGVDAFPDGVQAKEAFLLLEEEFSFGVVNQVEIAIEGDVSSAPVKSGVARLQARLSEDPDFEGQATLQDNGRRVTLLSVPVRGEPSSASAVDAVTRLREQYIPDAFSGVQAEVFVTGLTAFNLDFFEIADTYTPVVFAAVLGLSFLLLMLVFRSIVVPAKAIVMNLLSVGAAYGLMVLVFQKGVGSSLLGFQETEIIDAWIPLFLFSVLFGLSMDYHVFLLSRIRERYDQTHDNMESVAHGLRATAGLITGAALIMVAVFSGFAAGDIVSNQQVGFGLAVAVLLDATIVRTVLVPSAMRLLGNANWYLPSFLHWLPDLRVVPVGTAESPVADD